jgi:hypothetical protein
MKTSPFLRALKPAGIWAAILVVIFFMGGGEKGGAFFQILGLPWSYFAQYILYEQESLKYFLTYEGGASINAIVLYVAGVLWYSRK